MFGFIFPVWMQFILVIDSESGCKSKTELIRLSGFSWGNSCRVLARLADRRLIELDTRRKSVKIRLTERGKDMQKLLLFVKNYVRDD